MTADISIVGFEETRADDGRIERVTIEAITADDARYRLTTVGTADGLAFERFNPRGDTVLRRAAIPALWALVDELEERGFTVDVGALARGVPGEAAGDGAGDDAGTTAEAFACDHDGCEFTSDSERGLNIHRSKAHASTEEAAATTEDTDTETTADADADDADTDTDADPEAERAADGSGVTVDASPVGREGIPPGLDLDALPERLDGCETVHAVGEELGLTRGAAKDLLGELGLLTQVAAGGSGLDAADVHAAVAEQRGGGR